MLRSWLLNEVVQWSLELLTLPPERKERGLPSVRSFQSQPARSPFPTGQTLSRGRARQEKKLGAQDVVCMNRWLSGPHSPPPSARVQAPAFSRTYASRPRVPPRERSQCHSERENACGRDLGAVRYVQGYQEKRWWLMSPSSLVRDWACHQTKRGTCSLGGCGREQKWIPCWPGPACADVRSRTGQAVQ